MAQAPIWKCQLLLGGRPGLKGNGSPFVSLTSTHQPAQPTEDYRGPQRKSKRHRAKSIWLTVPARPPGPAVSYPPSPPGNQLPALIEPRLLPPSPFSNLPLGSGRPSRSAEPTRGAAEVPPLLRAGRGLLGQTKPFPHPPSWKPDPKGAGAHALCARAVPAPQLRHFLC